MKRREFMQALPAIASASVLWRWLKPQRKRKPEYFWWYCPIELEHQYPVGSMMRVETVELGVGGHAYTRPLKGKIVEKHRGGVPLLHGKVAYKCEIIR